MTGNWNQRICSNFGEIFVLLLIYLIFESTIPDKYGFCSVSRG